MVDHGAAADGDGAGGVGGEVEAEGVAAIDERERRGVLVGGALDGYDHKRVDGVEKREECARLCLMEEDFECRSAEYRLDERECVLSREDRRTQPEAFRTDRQGVDYIENQCAKRE